MNSKHSLRHIALIPDGNRRWARQHNLPVLAGHRQVIEHVFPALVSKMIDLQIPYFTLWAFSTENWQRQAAEVDGLMQLFFQSFQHYGQQLHDQNVRLSFIGRRDNLSPALTQAISDWTATTSNNTGLTLTLAFNYGGRDDILRAVNLLLSRGEYSEVGPEVFADHLDTSILDLPDPDLIIRPGGEQRLSGFMSWQSAYSELFFDEKLMPDFGPDDLLRAVDEYHSRQRRFGG